MGKKKDKATESKNQKAEKSKAESFLDNLRPTTGKSEHTRGTSNTKIETNKPAMTDKTKKAVAGGIVAVALSALTFVGLTTTSTHAPDDPVVQQKAPAAVAVEQQPARAASEAAAASMLPQPLAPQKTRLAEPSKTSSEVAKPSKTSSKKSAKLATKAKSKETVKKSVASAKKQKATVKKSKKTLAAKTID
jgi:hypothetical protein